MKYLLLRTLFHYVNFDPFSTLKRNLKYWYRLNSNSWLFMCGLLDNEKRDHRETIAYMCTAYGMVGSKIYTSFSFVGAMIV